ncbi:MAG: SGNH/GDSL hydrolase family protein [Armatimonadota bacterium]
MSDFMIQHGQTYLFQGDSITDCGRRDPVAGPMGNGYPRMVLEMVTALYPERKINFQNRGISGNTTKDLRSRWEEDAIALQPDWISILIGINDSHRWLFNEDPQVKVSAAEFRENYDWLLEQISTRTPARIILLDPFYITPAPADEKQAQVLDLLPEYIQVVRDMSAKYDTLLLPMHDSYQQHLGAREASCFCPEPVHPNHGGHMVMALELMKTLGAKL